MNKASVLINNKKVFIENETNLLELIRKANIEIPTFCYHSELSVYGACRLCLVDIEGRGLNTSCSTKPVDGMVIRTNTKELRDIRKITIELLLANGKHDCTTCDKSNSCKLAELAAKLGVHQVRFSSVSKPFPIDDTSDAIYRDPNKCVNCGDCVRYCTEIQSVGAIDFAYRGSDVQILPSFGKNLGEVQCVNCGQCVRVCPTGALSVKNDTNIIWNLLDDKNSIVVAQIAPAVRIAIGEAFGLIENNDLTGKITAALKLMGFNKVFDTSFTADMTVVEEANEFIKRKLKDKNLPIFTSCCPAWVKFAEQYCTDMLDNLSSCKSPQQMFGSIAKKELPKTLGVDKKNLKVVSIMPCTAKKYEAKRLEFQTDGEKDVDAVITTQELIKMINEMGINFTELEPKALDMPFGFKTGAGIIFGNSGGVSEAVLRYAYEKLTGKILDNFVFEQVRGEDGVRTVELNIGDINLRIAIVHGLRNARTLVDKIKSGEEKFDIVEIMSCPGGCIGGAGQPVYENIDTLKKRTKALYNTDTRMQLHKSQDNYSLMQYYDNVLGEPNSKLAHELLHTKYSHKKKIQSDSLTLIGNNKSKIKVDVCIGTSCFLRGSQTILAKICDYIENNKFKEIINVNTVFCTEKCSKGPTVIINGCEYNKTEPEQVINILNKLLNE